MTAELSRRPAGVLLIVRRIDDEPYLVFMRRSQKVHTHKGQISFPGGGFKPEDGTLENTALRETHEEIGIAPERLRILGALPAVDTIVSNFLIYPFVAVLIDPLEVITYIPDDFEVAEIIHIPLKHLISPQARQDEEWILRGQPRSVIFYNYEQCVIWGATAYIVYHFVSEIQAGKWSELF